MKIKDIAEVLGAQVITGDNRLEQYVEYAFASDLMSDVLTLDRENIVLITGLSNLQAVRTAEMADISTIIIGRNKKVSPEMRILAFENDIVVLECRFSLFKIAGELYKAGIHPVY